MSKLDERVLEIVKGEVTPEEIAKALNTSVCHATNVCLKLVEKGKLGMKYKVICPKCGEVSAEYGSIMEIPDEVECRCGHKFMPVKENIKIVFTKI